MNERVAGLLERIRTLEGEIESELSARRQEFGYTIEKERVHFEARILLLHRKLEKGVFKWFRDADVINILTSPAIYAMIFPLVFLDVMLSAYQFICFPGYGIPRVDRKKYISMDRGHLRYLNFIERLNCDYCAYANGLIAYAREVAGRTEQYFCPIKHAFKVFGTHDHYAEFLEYGDAESYRQELQSLRDKLKTEPAR